MDLRHLRSFIHVAETGSISAAAERLHIAQPALSRHIILLEQELETQLFTRHGRGVTLTEKGSALLPRALTILNEIEVARDEARSDNAELTGSVTVGFPPTVGHVLAGSLVDRFQSDYPRVKLRIVEGYSGYVLNWLQQGLLDVAILYDSRGQHSLKTRPLLVERLMVIGLPGSLDVVGEIAFRSLENKPLILPGPDHGLRLLLDQLAQSAGFELLPAVETDSLRLQIDLAKSGRGLTILPLVSVFREVERGELVAASLKEPEVSRQLILALPSDRRLTAATLKMEEMIRGEVRRLVEEGRWAGTLVRD